MKKRRRLRRGSMELEIWRRRLRQNCRTPALRNRVFYNVLELGKRPNMKNVEDCVAALWN
jgi:hypothetical protein